MNITIVFGNTSEVAALPMPIVIATLQADLMISTDQMSSKFIGDLLEAHGPVLEGHILIVTTDLSINGRYLSEWVVQFPQITSIRHAANWHDQYKAMRGPAAAFLGNEIGEVWIDESAALEKASRKVLIVPGGRASGKSVAAKAWQDKLAESQQTFTAGDVTIEIDGVKVCGWADEGVSENDPNVRAGLAFGDLKVTTMSLDADPKEVARLNAQFKRWAAEKLLPRTVIDAAVKKFLTPSVILIDEETRFNNEMFDGLVRAVGDGAAHMIGKRLARQVFRREGVVNIKGI